LRSILGSELVIALDRDGGRTFEAYAVIWVWFKAPESRLSSAVVGRQVVRQAGPAEIESFLCFHPSVKCARDAS